MHLVIATTGTPSRERLSRSLISPVSERIIAGWQIEMCCRFQARRGNCLNSCDYLKRKCGFTAAAETMAESAVPRRGWLRSARLYYTAPSLLDTKTEEKICLSTLRKLLMLGLQQLRSLRNLYDVPSLCLFSLLVWLFLKSQFAYRLLSLYSLFQLGLTSNVSASKKCWMTKQDCLLSQHEMQT